MMNYYWTSSLNCGIFLANQNAMDTPRQIHVDSTWVLCQHVEDQISTNFHIISVYFFDVISIFENATLFPRTFFDVILMVQKSTLFPRTFVSAISMIEKSAFFPRNFFDVLLMVEKSPLFPRTFVGVISIVEKSTLFLRTFFNVICLVEICTLFLTNVFNVILVCKDSTLFLVSCKLMKTFEKVFSVFVTLNSWHLQDCSIYVFQVNLLLVLGTSVAWTKAVFLRGPTLQVLVHGSSAPKKTQINKNRYFFILGLDPPRNQKFGLLFMGKSLYKNIL